MPCALNHPSSAKRPPMQALAVGIFLAVAFIFSCSSDGEEGNEPSSSSANSFSSSSFSSSSSLLYPSSSSVGDIIGDSSSSGNGQGGGSSSSSGVGDSGESLKATAVYALGNITDNTFECSRTYEWYNCKEGGEIERSINNSIEVLYSINNNILVWLDYWQDDTIHFSGTSNSLIGTWTRSKSIDNEIVKAEFTEDTLKVTSDLCLLTEEDDYEQNGWEIKVIDCNTYEYSKETEKVIGKFTVSSDGSLAQNLTYNGKTCRWDQIFTSSRSQAACTKAWDKAQAEGGEASYYYHNILNNIEVEECMRENGFPADFWEEDDEDFEESAMPKMLMKKADVKAKKVPFFRKLWRKN